MSVGKAAAWLRPVVLTFSAGPNAALLTLPDVTLMIADADYELVSASEVHEVLGTDGSAVTCDLVKAADGTTLAGGTSMLLTTFNLKATINTVQKKTLSGGGLAALAGSRRVLAGQRIGLNFAGTMTAVAGVNVTIVLKPLRRPNW